MEAAVKVAGGVHGADWAHNLIARKKENWARTKRRTKNGGVLSAAKIPKVNQYFLPKASNVSSQVVTTQPTSIPTQPCVDKDDNVKEDDDDEGKVEFFLRVGKHKKFKYF